MKIGHCAPGIGLERNHLRTDPLQQGKRQQAPDNTFDQIADQQAPSRGVAADPTFEHRV